MAAQYLTLQMDAVIHWVNQVGVKKMDWEDASVVSIAMVRGVALVEVEYINPEKRPTYQAMGVQPDEALFLTDLLHKALTAQNLNPQYNEGILYLEPGRPRNMVIVSKPHSWHVTTFGDELLSKFHDQLERINLIEANEQRIDWQAILKPSVQTSGEIRIQTPALQLSTIRNWLMNANTLPAPRLTNSTEVAEIVLAYKGLELVYEIKHTNVEKNHGPCHAVVGTIEMARLTGFLVDALVKAGVSKEQAKYNVYRTDGLPMPMYVKVTPHSWDAHVIGSTSVDEFEQLFERAKLNNQTVMTLFPREVIDNWLIPNKQPRPVPQWDALSYPRPLANPITKEPAMNTIFGVDMLKTFQPYLNIPLGDYKEEGINGVTVTINTLTRHMNLQIATSGLTGATDEYEFQFSEEQVWEAHRRFEAMFVKYDDRFRNIPRNDGVHSFRGGRGCPRYDFKLL